MTQTSKVFHDQKKNTEQFIQGDLSLEVSLPKNPVAERKQKKPVNNHGNTGEGYFYYFFVPKVTYSNASDTDLRPNRSRNLP
ncbi:hypothetical protein TNCV_4531911 [Trichonephila clavipes]|nr:hypothetical protein TNCV_4531911 [Trichonephila clavipes]